MLSQRLVIKIEFDQFLRGDFSIDRMRNLGIQMLTESREDLTKGSVKTQQR